MMMVSYGPKCLILPQERNRLLGTDLTNRGSWLFKAWLRDPQLILGLLMSTLTTWRAPAASAATDSEQV